MELSAKGVQAIEQFLQAYRLDAIIYAGDPEQLGQDVPLRFSIMLKKRKRPSQAGFKKNSRGWRMKSSTGYVMVDKGGESIEIIAKLMPSKVAIPNIWRPEE